jgi:hypothetical protein
MHDGSEATTVSQLVARLQRVTDDELVSEVERLARCERDATARLVAHLAELDARRLYLGAGFSSLFAYCTGALRLSEHAAYNRIEAARASRRFPVILDLLARGAVNLAIIRLLAPHLTADNQADLLTSASGRSRREVEELLAARFPQPSVPSSVRKLPVAAPRARLAELGCSAPPSSPNELPIESPGVDTTVGARVVDSQSVVAPPPVRRDLVAPLTSDLYRITFSARTETRRKLRMAQDLLRHQVPDGNLPEIFDRALSALLAELVRKKVAEVPRPRPARARAPGSRHIPAAVRRAVWLRDGGRCAFVAKDGRRCAERGFLEFHHAQPYAAAGEATERNIALRCRPHNGHEAHLYFGPTRSLGRPDAATRPGASR